MTVSGHWESVKFWYCPTWTTWLATFITAYTLWMEAFTMWVHLLVIIYYHYYCYCHFCTVLMAGFWVLHSSTPFSPFLLHSLFLPLPILLAITSISKYIKACHPRQSHGPKAPHRERLTSFLGSRAPFCCHWEKVDGSPSSLQKPTGLGGKCLIYSNSRLLYKQL